MVINQLVLDKKLMARQIEQLKLQVCSLQDQNSDVAKHHDKLKRKYNNSVTSSKGQVNIKLSVAVGVIIAVVFLFLSHVM